MNKIKRKRRTFTDDFKHQMVSLYQNMVNHVVKSLQNMI